MEINTIETESYFSLLLIKICILYNQRDAAYTLFFIIISAVHVSGGFSAHHQELTKLYVQLWVLSCFPAVCIADCLVCRSIYSGIPDSQLYREQESMTIPNATHTVLSVN
jgi:hypothetical protein